MKSNNKSPIQEPPQEPSADNSKASNLDQPTRGYSQWPQPMENPLTSESQNALK